MLSKSSLRLLIVGGYGTFGSRLAELLCLESALTLLIAGRSRSKAAALCDELPPGARREAVVLDREKGLIRDLEELTPDIVIDASGPFQAYGSDPYRLVKAALATRTHYLDLADSPAFVRGVAEFDQEAKEHGLVVLSGASTFPALSAAMVGELVVGLDRVDSIMGGVAPSPYAGVGYNVIRAIAGYAGKPIRVLRAGRSELVHGLTETQRYTIAPPGYIPLFPRRFSLVQVPDLELLVDHWPQVQTIWMGAAPEPAMLHWMLRGLAKAVSLGLIPSLTSLSGLMFRIVNKLRWGEHRGGMFVEIEGSKTNGERITRSAHLVAEGRHGLYIPSMALEALVRDWLSGRPPSPGARSAASQLEMEDYRRVFAPRAIALGVRSKESSYSQCLHEQILGNAWNSLPASLRAVHGSGRFLKVSGTAAVTRGKGTLAKLLAWMLRFPKAANEVPVTVTFERFGSYDKWTRDFGGQVFASTFTVGYGRFEHLLCERFGPLVFGMALVAQQGRLGLVMRRWSILGLPLPRALAPRGDSFEFEKDGRFCFDVKITLPLAGFVIRYSGHLNQPDFSALPVQ